LLRLAVIALCAAAALSGCNGDGSGEDAESSAPTTVATTTPGGLTTPGTVVALGKPATVVWTQGGQHTSRVALRVRSVKEGKVADLAQFTLNNAVKTSRVYYVRVHVSNVGRGDIGGAFLSVYGKVSPRLVVPPVTFGSTFDKCSYRPLPKAFGHGRTADVCVVLLAPHRARISAVEWRGASGRLAAGVEPVSWRVG
jgi:hypothetical protein